MGGDTHLHILVHVLILLDPAKWFAQRQRGDDVQREELHRVCEVHRPEFRSDADIFPLYQVKQGPQDPINVKLEVRVVLAGVLFERGR